MTKWPEKLVVLTAIPVFGLGVAEIIIGTIVYTFTSNLNIGAWYVGVFAVITGLIGFFAKFNRALIGVYPVMCFLTATVAFIGTLVDGLSYAFVGYLKACGNNGVDYWGDSAYYADVLESCELPKSTRDCYCVISHSSSCFSYDGNGQDTFDQNNCDPVIHEFADMLLNSWSICLALFFLCWMVFFIGCCACCVSMFGEPETKPPPLPDPSAPPTDNNNSYSNPIVVAYAEPAPADYVYADHGAGAK